VKNAKAFFAASALFLVACPQEPRERPDVVCADACEKKIVGCSEQECTRGCAFVLDRLVEHQQDAVLGCMERSKTCGDVDWAECAVKIGPHADGGPDVPPPLPSEF
jgi:hypothetical protein